MTPTPQRPAIILQADALRLPLADKSVDCVFTSPPYLDARTYGIGAQRGCAAWVEWMLSAVREFCRVSRGLVLVNCAGVTRNWCYQPGPEGLLYEWIKGGGIAWRPAYWRRVGIPGSGVRQWLRADVEYVLAFAPHRGAMPWGDGAAMGHPPKWAPGGEMSHRLSDGARVNQWGMGKRRTEVRSANGTRANAERPSHIEAGGDGYAPPKMANPGNVVNVKVGGGLMGSKLAHRNEAPFPEKLADFFIRTACPPGGIVLDPFGGSGTTMAAAILAGRRCITSDIRPEMVSLMGERLAETMQRVGSTPPTPPAPSLN